MIAQSLGDDLISYHGRKQHTCNKALVFHVMRDFVPDNLGKLVFELKHAAPMMKIDEEAFSDILSLRDSLRNACQL